MPSGVCSWSAAASTSWLLRIFLDSEPTAAETRGSWGAQAEGRQTTAAGAQEAHSTVILLFVGSILRWFSR